jgi:site-specific recombinase XerD
MKTQVYLSGKRKNSKDLAPVYCRVSYKDQRSEISLGVYVNPKDFCPKRRMVKEKHPMADSFNKRIVQSHARIYDIITHLSMQGHNTPNLVKEIFRNRKKVEIIDLHKTLPSFTEWCTKYINSKYTTKFRTQRNYQDALNHVIKLEMDNKSLFTRIDKKAAKQIYEYLKQKGLLYYLAKIKYLSKQYHEYFEEDNPLDKYRAPAKEKYEKGALSQEELEKVMNYRPKNALSQIYLDIFLFQYFSAGSRVGDVLRMRWKDIQGDSLKRVEEKTGKERLLPINAAMRSILNKYPRKTDFVFDLQQPDPDGDNRTWCLFKDKTLSCINSSLKTVRKNLNLSTHISSHTSRHTFATHTFETTKDVKTTSLLIGHSKLATTEMYLHADEQINNDLFAKVYENNEQKFLAQDNVVHET